MADAIKLLPCPFCGDEMATVQCGEIYHKSGDRDCPIIGRDHYIPAAHVDAWNRRASPPAREEAPAEGVGAAWKPLYDRHGYLNDPEGLARIRSGLLEVKDWHDLPGAIVNCNSLARLLDTIDALRNRTSEPEAGAVETLGPSADFWSNVITHPATATADKLREAAGLLNDCIWLDTDTGDYRVEHDGSVEKARAILAALNEGGE